MTLLIGDDEGPSDDGLDRDVVPHYLLPYLPLTPPLRYFSTVEMLWDSLDEWACKRKMSAILFISGY